VASRNAPTALIFTRQKTQAQARSPEVFNNIHRGGYTLVDCQGEPQAIIIATGSEVELATAAAQQLATEGLQVRVVSMPCVEQFAAQDEDYRHQVLPPATRARVAVEAGHPDLWYKFVGLDGAVVGIDRFGVSAPGGLAMAELGMTVDAVVAATKRVVGI
jgi:transketolase